MKRRLILLMMAVMILGGCHQENPRQKGEMAPKDNQIEQTSISLPEIMEQPEELEEMYLLSTTEKESDREVQYIPEGTPLYRKGEREDMECRILMYHDVIAHRPNEKNFGEVTSDKRFEENIKEIQKAGYIIVSLSDLLAYETGEGALPQRSVIITFDDGYSGNYTNAFPVIKRLNVPVTIFVVVARMESDGRLSWQQMREMEQSGLVDIQCHSLFHRDHASLSAEEVEQYYQTSFEILDQRLGEQQHRMLASPYGKYSEDSLHIAAANGVKVHMTVNWMPVDMNQIDLMQLPRFNVSYDIDVQEILTFGQTTITN